MSLGHSNAYPATAAATKKGTALDGWAAQNRYPTVGMDEGFLYLQGEGIAPSLQT